MKEGALHELPGGWVWTRLEDIVNDIEKVNPKETPDKEFIYLDIASIDNSQQKITNPKKYLGENAPSRARQLVKTEDILFSSVRTYLKNIAFVNEIYDNQIASTGFCVIRPHNLINKRMIFYLVQTNFFLNPLTQIQRGTNYPAVRESDVLEQIVPLPPLPEQRAIVSKIEQLFSDLDNGIDNFKKAQAQLKLYRQSVLKAACEGKLVPIEAELARAQGRDHEAADVLLERILKERREKWNGRGKYKEPEAMDTSGMPKLPEGWFWTRFEQIVSLSQNGFGKRLSKEGNPTIVLRLADITNGEISLNNVRRIGATSWEIEKYKLLNNDLLCIRVNGSRNLVGRMIRYKPAPEPITFCDHFIRFQLVEPTITHFLSIYFNTERARKFVEFNMVSTAGQNTVSQVTIMAIPFPLPPLAEQRRIIKEVERRLSVCDKMEATMTESLQKAESLRQSILKKAFEGKLLNKIELEIARNASDWEPAEKLLERIRQEKERTGEKKRKI